MRTLQFKTVGPAIAQARLDAGIPLHELATGLGVSSSFVSQVESGHKQMTVAMLRNLPRPLRRRVRETMIKEIESELRDE